MLSETGVPAKQLDLASRTYLRVHKDCTGSRHVCNFLRPDQLRARATESELVLWERIQDRQLGFDFFHQYPLLSYVVDFYCPERMLIVEVDGKYHDFRRRRDNRRTAILHSYGTFTIRITNEMVHDDLEGVVRRISGVLDCREAR